MQIPIFSSNASALVRKTTDFRNNSIWICLSLKQRDKRCYNIETHYNEYTCYQVATNKSKGNMAPVFMQLKTFLENEIAQGVYQPGDLIPSESELMKAWSVSRITVRNAVKQLNSEGLVYTVHGRGTFVAERKITNYLPSLTSLSQDILAKGMAPGRRVLKLEIIGADKDIATRLHMSPGAQVIHFIRVTLADEEPIGIGYTYVSVPAIAPHQNRFTVETLENSSFYQLLAEISVHLYGGVQTISASGANPLQAKVLEVKKGYPLIDSERVAFTRERKYVEYTRMLVKPDYLQWKVNLGPVNKNDDHHVKS